jgi:hypothetical protein
VDNYGNVVSLFARPQSPLAAAYDHFFFPFSRGGRTRDLPGSVETNIILIQWKANSNKSDILEQLLPPAQMATGVTPDQLVMGLKSSNGYYGVPALPFFLGYDPITEGDTLPDRANVFDNWNESYKNEILDALKRLRQAEVDRATKYMDKKTQQASRKAPGTSQTKVNPYKFSMDSGSSPAPSSPSSPSSSPSSLDGVTEYKIYLKACLVDGIIDPHELTSIEELREQNKISKQTHIETLTALGYSEKTFDEAVSKGKKAAAELEELLKLKKKFEVIPESAPTPTKDSKDKDLSQLTKKELADKCKELQLKVSGTKEELIQRIEEATGSNASGAQQPAARKKKEPKSPSSNSPPGELTKDSPKTELVAKCKELGLKVSGTKEELFERIQQKK